MPDHDWVAQGTGSSLAAAARSPGEAAEPWQKSQALPRPFPGVLSPATASQLPPNRCFREPVTFGLVV